MGAIQLNDTDPHSGYCRANGTYYSLRTPVPLPLNPDLSLPAFLLSRMSCHAKRTACVFAPSGQSVSYGDLQRRIRALAAGLVEFGVRKGDVVLLLLPNSIHFMAITLGVMFVGGLITATNPLNTSTEIATQAKDSGAKFVCTTPALLQKVVALGLPLILAGEGEEAAVSVASEPSRCTSLSQLLASDATGAPVVVVRQEETAALLYSSGTTGTNKGVILTHANLIALLLVITSTDNARDWQERVYLCLIPMFHIFGLAILGCMTLMKGCTTVIMPRFDLEGMLAAIQVFRVTHVPLVPPILRALAKSGLVNTYDLSSLRQVTCGAAPLSHGLATAFRIRFPNIVILQGYGLTEATGTGANSVTEEESEHYSSVGRLAANIEAKIVDIDSGNPLPPNKQGELWLRGCTIMKGYFGNPGATAAALDSEGWLHTGDLCYFDDEGFMYVIDRLKELIKYKGLQVAPAELEAVLLAHPEIVDAAVIPFPNEEAGQIPKAYIVKRLGSMLREVDVMNFVAAQVAPYKKIRLVVFVNMIPKSPAGKILRRNLALQGTSKL